MNIAIIGGGAAGYFSAINLRELMPEARVTIFEGSSRSLSKVAVSGGGRCNLTNTFLGVTDLAKVYPRGAKLMKRACMLFDNRDTIEWFESRGVALTAQADECIFPMSQEASQIVETFVTLVQTLGVEVRHSCRVSMITPHGSCEGYTLSFESEEQEDMEFDRVVVTTGGSSREDGYDIFSKLSLKIEPPVPSLFTFNIPNNPITQLMGAVVEGAEVSILASKFSAKGALLITHWGMSGPAILKLSAYGARLLSERDYQTQISVNWVGERRTERVMQELQRIISLHGAKLVTNVKPFDLPTRLWMAVLIKSGIAHERRFAEIGSKGLNRLVNTLTNDEYFVSGQSRFREEFVTCGGVSLSSVNLSSCEARSHKGLYIAGEALDVDAITGGFNLQAAWSTAFLVASHIAEK